MRHIIDFRNTSDTGETDSDAIVPYNDGESANQTVLRRPIENTRTRSETLRTNVREHVIMRDVDRNTPCVWGGGTITFNGTVAGGGGGDGKFTTTASLYVVPMLTAGDGVGTTSPYIASTKASLNVGSAGNNQVIIESVKKQFEGSDLAKADVNRLSVEILNDTAESIALEGATGDVNNVKITIIFGTTTADDLIDLINNDATVSQYVSASLESTSTGTNAASLWGPTEWGTDYTQRFLAGGTAGIIHEVPTGSLSSFFAADSENPLQKGDTLAIYYDAIIDDSGTGGVLQSTIENSNTSIGAGGLFNTRREPEKCPNAIPICKCIDDNTLLFVSGAYIIKDTPATLYADSSIETVSAEVVAARDSATFGAKASLDERIEAVDTHASTVVTVGPTGSGRMYEGDSALYNALNAYKDAGAIIICDQHTYTLDASLTITRPIRIVGKGTDSLTQLSFSTNTITFSSTAERSSIINMYLNGSGAGIQIAFNSAWSFMQHCKFNIQIQLNGANCIMVACESTVESKTSVIVDTGAPRSALYNCQWTTTVSSDHAVVNIKALHVVLDGCDFDLAGGNYIYVSSASAWYTVLRKISILAALDATSATPLVTLTNGSLLDGLTIYKSGATPITQQALAVRDSTAKNVYINCASQELRLGTSYFVRVETSSVALVGILDTFHICDFYLPFDTNSLSADYPLIDLYTNPTYQTAILRNGVISEMGHDGSPSGNMHVCLMGAVNDTDGPVVIENVRVDTTGITYATGTRYIIASIPEKSRIRNCRITGLGLFTRAIYVDTKKYVEILHNKIETVGAWESAIVMYDRCDYARCTHNEVVMDNDMTGGVIWFDGQVGSDYTLYCDISHNTVDIDGTARASSAGILLHYLDKGMVFGNIVNPDSASTPVDYNVCNTGMVPAAGVIGTYNVIT